MKRGLAQRGPDPDDGRGALISLSERGRELFEACAPEHLENSRELLAALTDHERDQLGDLLGKLLHTLEEPDPDDGIGSELGLVVDGASVALERRRAVGLPALSGLLVRQVDPSGLAAASGIRRHCTNAVRSSSVPDIHPHTAGWPRLRSLRREEKRRKWVGSLFRIADRPFFRWLL